MQQIHSLKEFLDSYGPSLAKRVNDELEVIHDPLNDETKRHGSNIKQSE